MAIIKNTIVIDDQASAALLAIQNNTQDAINRLKEMAPVYDAVSESMELAKLFSDNLGKSIKESADNFVNSAAVQMVESFTETKEIIRQNTEAVREKTEAVEEMQEAIENTGGAWAGNVRGIQQMTRGAQQMMRNVGGLPPVFQQATQSVTMLVGGLGQAVPAAAKLASFIAPITLVATGVMAIMSVTRMFGSTVENDIAEPVEDLLDKATRLSNESERLQDNLAENIRLLEIMGILGSNEGLVNRIQRENEAIEAQIAILNAWAQESLRSRATQAQVALTREQITREDFEGIGEWLRNPIGYLLGERRFEVTRADPVLQQLEAQIDAFREGQIQAFQETADASRLGNQAWNTLRENITIAMREIESLRGVVGFEGVVYDAERLIIAYAEVTGRTYILRNEVEELVEAYERQAALQRAVADVQNNIHRHMLRNYRDVYMAAERVTEAHYAWSTALDAMNNGQALSLDIFSQIMNLHPKYLTSLFDEYGAMRDIEEVTLAVAQAHIDLMGVRKAEQILDAAEAWQAETGSLRGYNAAVLDATKGIWGLVDARLEAMRLAEFQYLREEQGMTPFAAAVMAQQNVAGIAGQIDMIRNLTTAARQSALQYGVTRPILVTDAANVEIRDELLRLKEDVSARRFFEGAFQRATPQVTVNVGGISNTEHIYANRLSDADQNAIITRAAQSSASYVASLIEEAISNDLRGNY